jgi:ketosteroid isomerase-like protein
MTAQENARVVMEVFRAIENRELERLQALYHPEIEFHWQPGLPYGGSFSGPAVAGMSEAFYKTWFPLQPGEDTRRMDPRVVATGNDGRVIVNYLWRGLDPAGRRFETETLADYQVRDGRLVRAQMFYFDLVGTIGFLEQAEDPQANR